MLLRGWILDYPQFTVLQFDPFFSHTCFLLWVASFICLLLVGSLLSCSLRFLLPVKLSSLKFPSPLGSSLFLLTVASVFILISSLAVVKSIFFLEVFQTMKFCPLLSSFEETNSMSLWETYLPVDHSPTLHPNPPVSLECFCFFNILSNASLLPSNQIITLISS